MLAQAPQKAEALELVVDLREGDARALPYGDEQFDSVVCTYSLCAIPDDKKAVAEMVRVLRPGGLLLLADHVASTNWAVRAFQAVAEVVTRPMAGEYLARRPIRHVAALGLSIVEHERFRAGIIERLAAKKGLGNPTE